MENKIKDVLQLCVDSLQKKEESKVAIEDLLRLVGEYFGGDRSYIFEFDGTKEWMNNTYEWCREGVVSAAEMLQHIPISEFHHWIDRFERDGEVVIQSRREESDPSSLENLLLEKQGVECLFVAPIRMDNKLIGFLGVDNPKAQKEEIFLLKMISSFVSNDLLKRESEDKGIVKALAAIYHSVYLVHPGSDLYEEILTEDGTLLRCLGRTGKFSEGFRKIMRLKVHRTDLARVMEFGDLATLKKRLVGKKCLSCEFLNREEEWYRIKIIPVNVREKEEAKDFLFAVELIDEEKKKEFEYQRQLRLALDDQNVLYSEMLQTMSGGFMAVRCSDQKLIGVNEAAVHMFGLNPEKIKGYTFQNFHERVVLIDGIEASKKRLKELKVGDAPTEFQLEVRTQQGGTRYILSRVTKIILSNGTDVLIHCFTEISEMKLLEKRLRYMSEIDALTGINNRGSGEYQIDSRLKAGVKGMFCLLDINRFKSINDTFGHQIGDKVLCEVARCLKEAFRPEDVVMRLAGDEFAAFAVGITTEEDGDKIIRSFFRRINQIEIPELERRKIYISLGAVIYRAEPVRGFEYIYRLADSSMYLCKCEQGNGYIFSEERLTAEA